MSTVDPGPGPRPTLHQHHPHAVDGRRAEGELRPPRHADGPGPRGLPALHAASCATTRATPAGPTATASSSRAGHASMLLYSSLYLCGYGLTLDDLKNFRQLGSPDRRPPRVRPRRRHRDDDRAAGPGDLHSRRVWRWASACSPRASTATGHEVVDHHTYVIASDGDMEEGVQSEAASLAGHLGLGRLHRLLRRQPHLDRGRHRPGLLRGRRQALRGLRLARPEPRRGHRARPPGGARCARPRAWRTGPR